MNAEDVPCSTAAKPIERKILVGVNGWGIHGSFQIPEKYTMPLMKWLAKRALARKKQPNAELKCCGPEAALPKGKSPSKIP